MSKREDLEARAAKLKEPLKYPANISDAKLEEKIAEAEAAQEANPSSEGSQAKSQPVGGAGSTPPAAKTPAGKPKNGKGKAKDDEGGELVVVVSGPPAGRRRIGRRFGPEPVEIPNDDLSEDQKQALISDPLLSVTTVARANEG